MTADYEDKPQPLIEHLIELRKRLIWAVVAFFAAFLEATAALEEPRRVCSQASV